MSGAASASSIYRIQIPRVLLSGSVEQIRLWDLAGRKLGVPVWKLLGGYRDRVPAYGSTMCGDEIPGGLATPEDYARFAENLVRQGYQAIKLHTWMPPVSFSSRV